MSIFAAIVVCFIFSTGLSSAQENHLDDLLEELLNFHNEISGGEVLNRPGTKRGAFLGIQQAYKEHSIPHIIHQVSFSFSFLGT